MYHDLPAIRHRLSYNPAYMNPADIASLSLKSGDRVEIISDHGRIPAIVKDDGDVRCGVISMSHSWGRLPDDDADYEDVGSFTGLLISTDRDCDPLNAMPRMSAIPVRIEPVRSL
jgi:anaerobic selenocysteine-containing dehydrogenase